MAEVFSQFNCGSEDAKKELQMWKSKVEKADDAKSRLIMEKLEEDELKAKAKQEMFILVNKQEECDKEFNHSMTALKGEILKLNQQKQHLLAKLRRHQAELDDRRAETTNLQQKFKIYAKIPDTEVNFTTQHKETSDDSQPIKGRFTISQKANMLLQGGQALLTFEEENVASQILKIAKCSVSCENLSVDVKPQRIIMDPAVKFEVHLTVSRRQLKFFNVQPSMPEDRIKDRLEMSFSRPSRGGGEVERVEYDVNTGMGCITFLHPGVAGNLVLRGEQRVDFGSEVNVQVGPIYNYELRRFQTFCGVLKRTILLDDIKDIEDEEDLQDHLEIHFQKPSNYGGEIESIKYTSKGNALQAFFSEEIERDNI
ncbi:N-myc-interactor [Betta splendens]|uniref:N-myc-interactor n=1 Tax=Betta splendens TaxID=158456 RepID=A0A6P7LHF8_BETSP|nr:N-myc-interactor [Betta splendens]